MGTKQTSQNTFQRLNKQDLFLNNLTKIEDCSLFVIWKDSRDNYYQQYQVYVSADRSFQQELTIYAKRQDVKYNFVMVHWIDVLQEQYSNSGYRKLKVLCQHIPITLGQVSKIRIDQGLSILYQAILGFQCLFRHSGYFEINDQMIGFNTKCQVRVWINSNWSLNTKMTNKSRIPTDNVEHWIVLKLIKTVQNHIQLSQYLGYFIDKKKQIKTWSFQNLKQLIFNFANLYKFQLTKTLELEIFKLNNKFILENNKNITKQPKKDLTISVKINKQIVHTQFKQPTKIVIKKVIQITNCKKQRQSIRSKRKSQFSIASQKNDNKSYRSNRLSLHEIDSQQNDNNFIISSLDKLKLNTSKYQTNQTQEIVNLQNYQLISQNNKNGLIQYECHQKVLQVSQKLQFGTIRRHITSPQTKNTPTELQFKLKKKASYCQKNQRASGSKLLQNESIRPKHNQKSILQSKSSKNQKQSLDSKLKSKINIQSPITPQARVLSPKIKRSEIILFQKINMDKFLEPTAYKQNIKQSIITKCQSSEVQNKGKSISNLFINSNSTNQSKLTFQKERQVTIQEVNIQDRFKSIQKLQTKNFMTKSIQIASNKIDSNSMPKQKRPLSVLDLMVARRNQQKQNNNNKQLDISIEIDDELVETLHKSIVQMDQQQD